MRPDVSVVAAVYNDAGTLRELCDRVRSAFAGRSCEIVLVDDGSSDGSYELMQSLGVRAVRTRERAGQNAAILEGLRYAQGHYCCVLDADLEDPPEALPRLIDAMADGVASVVFSSRDGRRRLTSRAFRRVMGLIYPMLPSRACLCFAMDRAAAEEIVRLARPGDYLVAVIGALQLPAGQIRVTREMRQGRGSGYAGFKRLRHGLRMLTSAVRVRARLSASRRTQGTFADAGTSR